MRKSNQNGTIPWANPCRTRTGMRISQTMTDQLQHHACIRRNLGMRWNDDVSSMRARFICEWEDAAAEK